MTWPVSTQSLSDVAVHPTSVWTWWKRDVVLLAGLLALAVVCELGLQWGVSDAFFSPPVFRATNCLKN